MATDTYSYPDRDDRITTRFISEAEPYPGYWAVSDERAMARASEKLTTLLGPKAAVRALDAGCGQGRMLPWLARLAGRVTAIDPDAARLADAARQAAELGDEAEIDLIGTDVHALGDGAFDLVLCSHIIQHIPTAALVPLLTRLHQVTAPDGVLVLVYTRAPVGDEKFSLDRMDAHGVETRWVDQARFDEVAGGRSKDCLPIHYRDPIRLAELGRSVGWAELWSWSFHVLDEWPGFAGREDRDELVNGTPDLLRTFGRDAVTLWRRQPPAG